MRARGALVPSRDAPPLLAGSSRERGHALGVYPLTFSTWRKVWTTSTRSAWAAMTAPTSL